jgi:hypothetical protein
MNDYLYSERFFLDVDPIPGAIETIKEWKEEGHEVIIVSAPSWPGNSATDKITWVKERMPFFNKRDMFLGHHKWMIRGDILIDDSPDNIKLHRQEWGTQTRIMTIAYPFNEPVKHLVDVFALDYLNPLKAWAELKLAVERLANLTDDEYGQQYGGWKPELMSTFAAPRRF